jgi:predicted O-methyltransferase YrrM
VSIFDPDYQRFPYVFNTEAGYFGDMSEGIRRAIRASVPEMEGKPFRLLEIGVWEGRSACWLLDNLLTHPDSRYIGIDLWVSPPDIPGIAMANLAHHGSKAYIITGDSRIEVPRLRDTFPLVVVDGNHAEDGCYADLVNCWEKLTAGGVIVCDDYRYPGIPGVPLAVHRFIAEKGDHLEVLHRGKALAFRRTA